MDEDTLALLERLMDLHIQAGTTIDYTSGQDIEQEAEYLRKMLTDKTPEAD